MAYKYLFMDNSVYTAQDVNDALSHLISGGISGYPFGNNALSDLNTAIAELVEGGAQFLGTSCKVVIDGGSYKISEGVCIMNDGSQIVFDEDGYEITHTSGRYEYVYLERDVLHNRINVCVSEEAGGEDTIPLAEIKTDGTILDRRQFAKAKVSLQAEPQNIGVSIHIVSPTSVMHTGDSFEVETGFNGWEYIIFSATDISGGIGILRLRDGETITNFPIDQRGTAHNRNGVRTTRNGSKLLFESMTENNTGYDIEVEVR